MIQGQTASREGVSLAPFAVSKDVLLEVARELRESARIDDLRARSACGKLILDRCYNGSETAWRDKRKNKSDSIRRLARLDECPFGATYMRECVGIFLLCEKMPFILERPELNATHVAAVLGLAEDEQRRFLDLATEQLLSGRALKQLVIGHRRSAGERRGRRPIDAPAKSLGTLRESIRVLKQFAKILAGHEPIDDAGRAKLALMLVETEELVVQCRTLLETSGPHTQVELVSTANEEREPKSRPALRAVAALERIELQTGTCG